MRRLHGEVLMMHFVARELLLFLFQQAWKWKNGHLSEWIHFPRPQFPFSWLWEETCLDFSFVSNEPNILFSRCRNEWWQKNVLYIFVNVNGKVLQQRVWDMVHRGPLLVTTRAISLLNGLRNRQLGLFHPYKWSYGPLLITGRGPPCMCFELQVLRLTRRFFEPM